MWKFTIIVSLFLIKVTSNCHVLFYFTVFLPKHYNLSTTLFTASLHCSAVKCSLFNIALEIAMVCTTLEEFTHTRPFNPTVDSNLKYLPSASNTVHDGDKSLWKSKFRHPFNGSLSLLKSR